MSIGGSSLICSRDASIVYGEAALSVKTFCEWFHEFENGADKERNKNIPKIYEDEELKVLLDEHSCQT